MATVDVLKGARALIEQGWTQGLDHDVVDGVDCYCLSGALAQQKDWQDASELLHSLRPDFVDWNDRPDRTKEEVLELLDQAIELVSVE